MGNQEAGVVELLLEELQQLGSQEWEVEDDSRACLRLEKL
jgi:hypothetical protein